MVPPSTRRNSRATCRAEDRATCRAEDRAMLRERLEKTYKDVECSKDRNQTQIANQKHRKTYVPIADRPSGSALKKKLAKYSHSALHISPKLQVGLKEAQNRFYSLNYFCPSGSEF